MIKSVVLLSSGLDSTVNLYEARRQSEVVMAITVNYGQRAAAREIEFARRHCELFGIRHKVVELSWFADFTQTSLVNTENEVPVGDRIRIDDLESSEKTARAVWVPNRNGILLNVAAAYAEGAGASWIVPGFNAEEATTFPDNSEDYLNAVTQALAYSTANKVEAKCFTVRLNKTEIVRRGRELGVRFDLIWPCYFGGEKPCGQCESCQRFNRAVGQSD
jgi:7-cyano-7-deazaguanine synthase